MGGPVEREAVGDDGRAAQDSCGRGTVKNVPVSWVGVAVIRRKP